MLWLGISMHYFFPFIEYRMDNCKVIHQAGAVSLRLLDQLPGWKGGNTWSWGMDLYPEPCKWVPYGRYVYIKHTLWSKTFQTLTQTTYENKCRPTWEGQSFRWDGSGVQTQPCSKTLFTLNQQTSSSVNNHQITVRHFSDTLQPNKHWPTETDADRVTHRSDKTRWTCLLALVGVCLCNVN